MPPPLAVVRNECINMVEHLVPTVGLKGGDGGRNPHFYPAYPSAYIWAIDLSKHVAHCEHPHFQRFHLRHHTQTHVSRIPHRVRHATLQTRAGLKPPVNSKRRKARTSALQCTLLLLVRSGSDLCVRGCVRGVATALEVK